MYFGSLCALNGVDFSVSPGSIHGLLGENGAGKSTLMNILGGVLQPSGGEIFINGEAVSNLSSDKCARMGIRFIHQELSLVNDLRVYENLFLHNELIHMGFLNKKEMIRRAEQVLQRMHIDIDPMTMMADLDISHKQLCEIARALLYDAELIIMDEPTSALANKEIENLFKIMRELKEQGVSIIYISHKMPELFAICDDYTVLRDGKLVHTGCFSEIDEHKATEMLVGRTFVDQPVEKEPVTGGVVFCAQNLTCDGYFEDISFDVRKGEVLAITGLFGDGRGELSESLFGARKLNKGRITFHDKPLRLHSIKGCMKAGVGMVPRNRKERSIIKDLSILDNTSMAYFVCQQKRAFRNKNEEKRRFSEVTQISNLKYGEMEDYITSLSGGNQQKVVVSRWLNVDCDLYILDNPTQGIDVGAKFEIYKLINTLAQKGCSVIVFSQEFPEIYKIADRCLVMYKGRVSGELGRDELTELKVMKLATGTK